MAPHGAGRAGPGHQGLSPVTQMGSPSDGCGGMAGPGPGCGAESRSGLGSGLLRAARSTTAWWSRGRAEVTVQGHGQTKQSCQGQIW